MKRWKHSQSKVKAICKKCDGRGHVPDLATILSLTLMTMGLGAFFVPFQFNEPNGITRMSCQVCNGRGYL